MGVLAAHIPPLSDGVVMYRPSGAEHLVSLRVHAGHDVPNGAVLPSDIHSLKHQQDGVAVRRIEELLLIAKLDNVVG
jgi:hypothetical protein